MFNLGQMIGIPVWYVYGGMTLIVIGFVFIVLSAIKTPMFTWWKAFLYRRPLIAIARRDKYIDFQVPKVQSGCCTIKKYGFFEFNPNGIWNWPKGVWGGFALSDKISLLTPELIAAADVLLTTGFSNYSEAEVAEYLSMMKDRDELTYLQLENSKQYDGKFLGYAKDVIEKGLHKKMQNGKLINKNLVAFHTIKNFFKYNATPSGTQKVINNEKANLIDKMSRHGFELKMDHVIGFIIVLIGAAFAYLIFQQGGVGQASSVAASVGDTAKQMSGNIGM